jgi:folate-binding protein YgfZ
MSAEDNFPQTLHEITPTPEGRILRLSEQRYELWVTSSLQANSDTSEWVAAELAEGVVWVDDKTTEEYIPQMFNLHGTGGISFTKGCYLGQEIVARMQYRGELKNRLHLGDADTAGALSVGTKIVNLEGKNAGAVVGVSNNRFAAVLRVGETGYQLEDGKHLEATLIA